MKKKVKRLELSKETLRRLELTQVRGGLEYTGPGVCGGPDTDYNSCQRYCQREPI
jgi:hypothetical protein